MKGGRGLEHQFPHLNSQVGDGDVVTVDVQRVAVVLVLVVVIRVFTGVVVVVVVEGLVTDDFVVVVVEGLVTDDVVVVVVETVDEVDEDEDEVVVLVVIVEDTGGAPQGSVDSKSVATYKFKVELPPQISVELPVQGMLHELAGRGMVPLPKTTPQ